MTSKSFRFRTADEALSFEGETMSVSKGVPPGRVEVSLFCFAKQLMVRVTNQCPGSLRNQSPWDDRFLNRTLVGIARLCRHGRRFLLSVPRKGLQPRVSKAPGSNDERDGRDAGYTPYRKEYFPRTQHEKAALSTYREKGLRQ